MDLMSITLVVRWLIGWGLMWQLPGLPDLAVVGSPKVSVLIPARNEESTLPHLLTALKQQTFKPYEIIVINDQSADATAAGCGNYWAVCVWLGSLVAFDRFCGLSASPETSRNRYLPDSATNLGRR
jgi:cellulose synthase/poly-beta-1,6-N-acetylglucosamine synthase-like glycosyltransferase